MNATNEFSKDIHLTHLDLFSGGGLFGLAARWAGLETVAFSEIDAYANQVLQITETIPVHATSVTSASSVDEPETANGWMKKQSGAPCVMQNSENAPVWEPTSLQMILDTRSPDLL